MSDHAAHADQGDHGGHDAVHHYNYVKIWIILCVLLAISVAGPELEMPIVTLLTAFGIAFVKAGIVIKYFMHLTTQKPFVHYFLITALVFMVLFFAGTAPDVSNHEGQNWENVAAKEAVIRGMAAGDPADHHGDEAGGHEAADDHGAEGAKAGEGGH